MYLINDTDVILSATNDLSLSAEGEKLILHVKGTS